MPRNVRSLSYLCAFLLLKGLPVSGAERVGVEAADKEAVTINVSALGGTDLQDFFQYFHHVAGMAIVFDLSALVRLSTKGEEQKRVCVFFNKMEPRRAVAWVAWLYGLGVVETNSALYITNPETSPTNVAMLRQHMEISGPWAARMNELLSAKFTVERQEPRTVALEECLAHIARETDLSFVVDPRVSSLTSVKYERLTYTLSPGEHQLSELLSEVLLQVGLSFRIQGGVLLIIPAPAHKQGASTVSSEGPPSGEPRPAR